MSIIITIALSLFAIAMALAVVAILVAALIAKREPDVNGDPERDADRNSDPRVTALRDRVDQVMKPCATEDEIVKPAQPHVIDDTKFFVDPDMQHIVTCEVCGKPVDRRNLDQVLFHEDHQPHPATGLIGIRIN